MGVILLPNGMPGTKVREMLSKEDIKIVTEFEAWCTRRKIALDLICRHCLDEGHGKESRLVGNNSRDQTVYRMNCAHAERVYGAAV